VLVFGLGGGILTVIIVGQQREVLTAERTWRGVVRPDQPGRAPFSVSGRSGWVSVLRTGRKYGERE